MSTDGPGRTWGAASDLARVLPTGTARPIGSVPAPEPVPEPNDLPAGMVVASPPAPRPNPKPLNGIRLSLPARIVVGIAIGATLVFMVWNAWQNLVG